MNTNPSDEQFLELMNKYQVGDKEVLNDLTVMVYQDLRRRAGNLMKSELQAGASVQPTMLANDAVLKLLALDKVSVESRQHFLNLATRYMRNRLVDHARKKKAEKRFTSGDRVEFNDQLCISYEESKEIVNLHDALKAYSEHDKEDARALELHYFGGLTVEEIAAIYGSSPRTVKRRLQVGRAFLKDWMENGPAWDDSAEDLSTNA